MGRGDRDGKGEICTQCAGEGGIGRPRWGGRDRETEVGMGDRGDRERETETGKGRTGTEGKARK